MIRTIKEGAECINSLCGNFPRFTLFVDEEKYENDKVNGGVCRLFLKDKTGKYTIPTPFFGFWSGYFAGKRDLGADENYGFEEYYELVIAGDCRHNFVNFRGAYKDANYMNYKFYTPIAAHCCYCKNNEIVNEEFDGKPIYPDILFSDFIYSTVFNFGKEGWNRFFEMVGKYVFISSPVWKIVERKGKFVEIPEAESRFEKDVVKNLKKCFKLGEIALDNSREFDENLESMCFKIDKCREESLDKLGEWLLSKGYKLREVKKMYCVCKYLYDCYGGIEFDCGWGYDFSEIAFALLRKECEK